MLSFKLKGLRVNLKPSFFVMCLIMLLIGRGKELCVIVFSVTTHELAHVAIAYTFGIKAESITVSPIGEVAHIYGMESISFFRRLLIILAGPMINLIFWLLFGSYINLALFIFNILPVYPLDGGRFLHYVLGYILGVLRASRVLCVLSKILAIIIFILGIFQTVLYNYNLSLIIIGVYLIKINKREYINMTFSFYRSIMYRSDKKVLGVRGLVAGENILLKTIVYRLGWDYYTIVYVRNNNGSIMYSVNEEELISYILLKNLNYRLRDIVD